MKDDMTAAKRLDQWEAGRGTRVCAAAPGRAVTGRGWAAKTTSGRGPCQAFSPFASEHPYAPGHQPECAGLRQ